MVRKVRANQQEIARSEWPDMVADEHLAGALGDHVDFEFRVVVPTGERAGVVVPMPTERRQGVADDQLEVRNDEPIFCAVGVVPVRPGAERRLAARPVGSVEQHVGFCNISHWRGPSVGQGSAKIS
jgi:hypothetical protein